MAAAARSKRLTTEQREVVRDAAGYAGTWVALRARRLRIPGVQVAVAVAGEIVLSSGHGFARLPQTNGDDDEGEPGPCVKAHSNLVSRAMRSRSPEPTARSCSAHDR